MAMSRDLLPADMDWIHELAKNEINPEAANIFNAVNQFDPKQIIEESTIEFLESLRELFTTYARVFNSYSEGNNKFSDMKIYGITNTAADFMLFRNNVKLVFANTAHGIINSTFTQHVRDDLSVDGTKSLKQSQDILAQMGPFMDVSWTYQGEKVNPQRLVKYYFVEFIRASRVARKGSTNQLLLKQIKALLQDQGIDL
ncbi:MAG: hypothetical protein AB1540_02400 [Bdellovibrionota bacterium]